jgi:hypothetical protein
MENDAKAKLRRVYLLLAAIAGAALVLLALLWDSTKDTLAFEAAKGCIGILSVALVGLVVSIALQTVQADRRRREAEADRKRANEEREGEAERERWQRDVERQREDWRRDVERRRDERERKDALLRALLEETLANYHEVKRARRLLKARVWAREDGDRIDLRVYDEHLATINDAQLNFELLKRTVNVISDDRLKGTELDKRFGAIEEYLQTLVREYEKQRRHIAHAPDGTSIAELSALRGFVEGPPFRTGTSNNVDMAVESLRKALLAPLEIPHVNRASSSLMASSVAPS